MPAVMIRSKDNDWLGEFAPQQWRRYVSQIETLWTPGNHTTMMLDPLAESFANLIRSLISTTDGAAQSEPAPAKERST